MTSAPADINRQWFVKYLQLFSVIPSFSFFFLLPSWLSGQHSSWLSVPDKLLLTDRSKNKTITSLRFFFYFPPICLSSDFFPFLSALGIFLDSVLLYRIEKPFSIISFTFSFTVMCEECHFLLLKNKQSQHATLFPTVVSCLRVLPYCSTGTGIELKLHSFIHSIINIHLFNNHHWLLTGMCQALL